MRCRLVCLMCAVIIVKNVLGQYVFRPPRGLPWVMLTEAQCLSVCCLVSVHVIFQHIQPIILIIVFAM